MGHSPRHCTRASHSGVRLRNKTYGEGPARDNRNHLFPNPSSADCSLHVGARGPTPQVAGTGSYPLEWTSKGPGSNLNGGTIPEGRSPAVPPSTPRRGKGLVVQAHTLQVNPFGDLTNTRHLVPGQNDSGRPPAFDGMIF